MIRIAMTVEAFDAAIVRSLLLGSVVYEPEVNANGSVLPNANQVRVNARLIDADSGAHLWAEQFDVARADLLRMQDEIVTHLARLLEIQLVELKAVRLKQTPAANPNTEDLALQCEAATVLKGAYFGKEAEVAYRFCEQALDVDPNNANALSVLSVKFWAPVALGISADPTADLRRGEELVSKGLIADTNNASLHMDKGSPLYSGAS
jgi:hypothetical protein